MSKPTPFEVWTVAKFMHSQQTCHPSNRYALFSFVPEAIGELYQIEQATNKAFNGKTIQEMKEGK
jgi:hypothetical protein